MGLPATSGVVVVIGGGLAGCEAAWQAARQGACVDLYEMRPFASGPAHKTGALAELVCSNSLRGASLENAVGLLKEELARLDSIVVHAARETAVPAGGALAVDRERFSALVEARIAAEARITVRREEVAQIPLDVPAIVACGPLPSDTLLAEIDRIIGPSNPVLRADARDDASSPTRLHYYDAASPIVSADSIDETRMYRKSRYDKGDGDDYLNIPLTPQEYARLLADLRTLPRHETKAFEEARYFEGCLPIEEMADRGDDVLRFGPMKPVGLRDPRTGRAPYAVLQLRKENSAGTAYNLVGFQTRLTWPSQRQAFGRLPGLEHAEWLRLGVMHRNTFIDSPRLLDGALRLRGTDALHFAGQITGAEGYVEAAACGAMAGIHAARRALGREALAIPRETALGAVVAHLQNSDSPDFQPANVTWAFFPALDPPVRDRSQRKRLMAERALAALDSLRERLQPQRELAGSKPL
ncbi:MAG: methylenetetrahydrofolate--tRNA-(uracil(54)-C(5))-methyltransferase (FADH(2)-oxidizing) TrmFO [Candidatus Tyrphobacter sp.]